MTKILKKNLYFILLSIIYLSACNQGVTDAEINPSPEEDAAESMATTIGQETGGAADMMGDVSEIASDKGLQEISKEDKSVLKILATGLNLKADKIYDPVSQKWTVNLNREKGSIEGVKYSSATRVYQYQFLNSKNLAQKNYITENDTATTLIFIIVSGSGYHKTSKVTGALKSISGVWQATGLNTNTITINGTFAKSGIDTVNTRKGTRIIEHTINLSYADIVGVRGSGRNWYQTATGSIKGTYKGNVTIQKGADYKEKTIDKNIEVVLGNSGKTDVKIGGKKFIAKLLSGELES